MVAALQPYVKSMWFGDGKFYFRSFLNYNLIKNLDKAITLLTSIALPPTLESSD